MSVSQPGNCQKKKQKKQGSVRKEKPVKTSTR